MPLSNHTLHLLPVEHSSIITRPQSRDAAREARGRQARERVGQQCVAPVYAAYAWCNLSHARALVCLVVCAACAIYGVDAHPSYQLFATAGGGAHRTAVAGIASYRSAHAACLSLTYTQCAETDNAVKIWSLEPQADGIATFELLATLAFHQQAVNCVRWAGHGRCAKLPHSLYSSTFVRLTHRPLGVREQVPRVRFRRSARAVV